MDESPLGTPPPPPSGSGVPPRDFANQGVPASDPAPTPPASSQATPTSMASTPPPPPPPPRPASAAPPPPPLSGVRRPEGPAWSTPPSGGRSRLGIIVLLLIAFLGIGMAVVWSIGSRIDFGGLSGARSHAHARDGLKEIVVEEGSSRSKIALIDVAGVITSEPFDHEGNNLVSHIDEQLERAARDHAVKAVILKIDSPGGEVLASDEIYKLIAEFQDEYKKPVVASMGTVAASGGYYVAAPCRWVVAHELTITGSIGVIMQSYNWRGLMDKLGVRPQVFKSGQLKDMLSPDKSPEDVSPEERRIVQDLVNETFERFKSVVEEGRKMARARNEDNPGDEADQGRVLAPNWKEFADGRLLSGTEAWRLGFVDELGDFSAARARAEKLADASDATLVQYLRPATFSSLFRLFGKAETQRIQLDLGVKLPQVRAGIYFLAPQLMR